jgi:hypothetical protein
VRRVCVAELLAGGQASSLASREEATWRRFACSSAFEMPPS